MTKLQRDELLNMDCEECISTLEALPPEELDYELIGLLARAYNNNDQEEKAKELLLTTKAEGENDGLWNYRMGYSCYYLFQHEEALAYLERAKELGCGEWADELLPDCKYWLLQKAKPQLQNMSESEALYENEYGCALKHEDSISVCFYIEGEIPLQIGEKMNEIHEEAYMNGYNWEAFFNFYLPKYAPDIMIGMETDPEAGMYAAYYDLNSENEKRAKKFLAVIKYLMEHEKEIYRVLKEDGDKIEWD